MNRQAELGWDGMSYFVRSFLPDLTQRVTGLLTQRIVIVTINRMKLEITSR